MTEREKFEAWAASDTIRINIRKDEEGYLWRETILAWEAWQARGLSVEEGCTETDAKMLRTTNQKLIAENEHLKDLLSEAATDLEDWGGYASEYLQEKHNLKADVLKYREAGE